MLISALGGEGGAVLTNWIVGAARSKGLTVQSTSVPGVAQRTGATTYYLELFTEMNPEHEPILALNPAVGDLDLMVASEISEAGRAIHAGYVSPDRTTVIASTNRVYSITEKVKLGDGRFDSDELIAAINDRSKQALLHDYRIAAKSVNSSLNAVLFGLIARSNLLPIETEHFAESIRRQGIAVDANLRGFEAGLSDIEKLDIEPDFSERPADMRADNLEQQVKSDFPEMLIANVIEAVRRLTDYQDDQYAALYLDRLKKIMAIDSPDNGYRITAEASRLLATRMSFEDIIRVAQLKIRPERYNRILEEANVAEDQLIAVTEYFKPSAKEISAILPVGLGRWLLARHTAKPPGSDAKSGMKVRSTTIFGFMQLWFLAKMRRWRRSFLGFTEVQIAIEEWLEMIEAAKEWPDLAFEIVKCAELFKGYGDTYERSQRNFASIRDRVIKPALEGNLDPAVATDAIANARVAALSDSTGGNLDKTLSAISLKMKAA